MSDAAYEILTSDSTTCTGNFFIDDELVRDKVASLEKYSIYPGEKLHYDFFVSDQDDKELVRLQQIKTQIEQELPKLEQETYRLLMHSRL
jgi:hypothetical protein